MDFVGCLDHQPKSADASIKRKKLDDRTMARKISLFLSLLFLHCFAIAQRPDVPMADGMRANGKIYVVVAIIVTIFAGIVLYLIRLDRKLTKLEKNHYNS
jgi:hypothetical protein